jgi:hypothetical protein
MRHTIVTIGLSVGLCMLAVGQHLQGWDTYADVGFSYGCLQGGSGIGYCQWITVRGERDLPPRTGAVGCIRNIRVVDSGEPFGRVLLLWSGWASHSAPDAGYWLKGIEWSSPIYEAAHVGDTFSFGNNTLLGYMWNGSYIWGRYRAVQAGVYVAPAPQPQLYFTQPTWNISDYRARDLQPNRLGIQIDPCFNRPSCDRLGTFCRFTPFLSFNISTNEQPVYRRSAYLKRVTGLDQSEENAYPSLFRDDITLEAVLRLNGEPIRTLGASLTYNPGERGGRVLPNQTGTWLRYGLPQMGLYHVEYIVRIYHKPYDKNGSPIWIEPRLTPVEYLRQADRVYFDLRHLFYRAYGAVNRSGEYSDAELPPVCIPKQTGSLEIHLNLRDFGLTYDYEVTLGGTALNDDTVEWSLDEIPNRCVNVEGVNVLIYRVWGRLRARLQLVPTAPNDLCGRAFNLVLTPIDGDDGNQLNAELYVFCQHTSSAKVNVEVRQIDYIGRSGNPDATVPNNPHLLGSFYDSETIEFMLYGDANRDGIVDDADLLTVLFEFGSAGLRDGDVNGDGHVDDSDLLVVLFQFGRRYGDCCRVCPPPDE